MLLTVVLTLTLRRQEMGIVLAAAVCAMIALAALEYLRPVIALLETLREMGELDGELISVLLKAAGLGLVTEIASLICADSGNASLGKCLQLLGTAVILWMSVPLFHALLELIREILGEL